MRLYGEEEGDEAHRQAELEELPPATEDGTGEGRPGVELVVSLRVVEGVGVVIDLRVGGGRFERDSSLFVGLEGDALVFLKSKSQLGEESGEGMNLAKGFLQQDRVLLRSGTAPTKNANAEVDDRHENEEDQPARDRHGDRGTWRRRTRRIREGKEGKGEGEEGRTDLCSPSQGRGRIGRR